MDLLECLAIHQYALQVLWRGLEHVQDVYKRQEQTEKALRNCALNTKGVEQVDLLKTRIFGNKVYVEMEIGADENLSLKDSHAIAENVHDAIEQGWPKIKHILIHVNPVRM